MKLYAVGLLLLLLTPPLFAARGTGDLGLLVERGSGSIQIVETSGNTSIGRVEGLGDLSHASALVP